MNDLAVLPALPVNLSVETARLPVAYETAKTALAQCVNLDECQDWADKHAALASYARQAKDIELRNMCQRIQDRAVRRCGELLKQIPPAPGGDRLSEAFKGGDAPTSGRFKAAKDAGLSRDQTVTALRVAEVPSDVFERMVDSDSPPTVTALAELGTKKRPEHVIDDCFLMRVADITISDLSRKDLGDLSALAEDIKAQGLVQPIGVTPEGVLVFGLRRLFACRDLLGWEEIEVRIVNVTGIVAGELDANVIRNEFTPTERFAIMETVKENLKDKYKGYELKDIAAKLTGFGSEFSARQIEKAIQQGVPELLEIMDTGQASIPGAEFVSKLSKKQQEDIVKKAKATGSKIKGVARAHNASETKLKRQQTHGRQTGQQREYIPRVTASPDLPKLTREEVGRPPAHLATKEHPDHPGLTYDIVWIMENGSVHTRSKADAERVRRRALFGSLGAWLRQGDDAYDELAEEWQRLDDRKGLDLEEPLIRIAAKLNALLTVIYNPPAIEEPVVTEESVAQDTETEIREEDNG